MSRMDSNLIHIYKRPAEYVVIHLSSQVSSKKQSVYILEFRGAQRVGVVIVMCGVVPLTRAFARAKSMWVDGYRVDCQLWKKL